MTVRKSGAASQEPKVIRDGRGREVVISTTPSGVKAWIDTSISDSELAAFARSLERRIRRRKVRAT